ncbi:MAG: HAMP domain-containing histidine kinase [Clostridiales bacterium]|jgi:signal transduction histidine kinase|nr:HAMP domain-containing histidine kinase [Clostridiales bacterium]
MFHSIFSRQVAMYLAILVISLAALSFALTQVIRGYFTDQRVAFLTESSQKIAQEYSIYYQYGVININQVNEQAETAHHYLDASIIILDDELNVFQTSSDLNVTDSTQLDVVSVAALLDGETIVKRGTMNFFPTNRLIVGSPILHESSAVGGVLLISKVDDLEQAINSMYIAVVVCLFAASAMGFVMIFFLSRSITSPLRQMNLAAKQIASGEFNKRLLFRGKDEVSELAHTFNFMADSLEAQENSRREFIANISHDLRSPLTSIRGFIQAIQDGAAPPDKVNHYLDIVLEESDRLSKLARDVVDLSEAEAERMSLNEVVFDINGLIRETAMMFETRIIEKNLTLNLNFAYVSNYVKADRDKIYRVIYNLLDNAQKFTPSGGEITIETTLTGGLVKVVVKDTGVGISEEDQKRVFGRFYKADISRGEDKNGNGLGLAIVREFTRLHGSSVALESGLGQGSSFSFALKSATPDAPAQ